MSSNLQIDNSFNDIFGVKHYNVKIVRKKILTLVLNYTLKIGFLDLCLEKLQVKLINKD